jgi:hypothetical protein
MKIAIGVVLIIILIYPSILSQSKKGDWPVLKGPYLGQKPPGEKPEIFAAGILSPKGGEFNSAFSPDGDEFYYSITDNVKKKDQIMVMKRLDNVWTKPEIARFSGQYDDCDISLSVDGDRLFFISIGRRLPGKGAPTKRNYMWFMNRAQNGWNEPKVVDYPGNLGGVYPVSIGDGTLYFSARLKDSYGKTDVYRCRYDNGSYGVPENLGTSINSIYGETDAYIEPKERFIIVTCWERPENIGGNKSDLYISFRMNDGAWTKLKNMGKLINTGSIEFCPMVSPEGKFLFFSSDRLDEDSCNIYWVDAKILEKYKPKKLK